MNYFRKLGHWKIVIYKLLHGIEERLPSTSIIADEAIYVTPKEKQQQYRNCCLTRPHVSSPR